MLIPSSDDFSLDRARVYRGFVQLRTKFREFALQFVAICYTSQEHTLIHKVSPREAKLQINSSIRHTRKKKIFGKYLTFKKKTISTDMGVNIGWTALHQKTTGQNSTGKKNTIRARVSLKIDYSSDYYFNAITVPWMYNTWYVGCPKCVKRGRWRRGRTTFRRNLFLSLILKKNTLSLFAKCVSLHAAKFRNHKIAQQRWL